MPKYVAFLRAINVGGHTVKMDHLRQLFEALGFAKVETFIASGNVIFESRSKNTKALETRIENHLRGTLGYTVATFIRLTSELAAIGRYRPFDPELIAQGGTLYIGFTANEPSEEAKQAVQALTTNDDALHLSGREVYWLCRKKSSESEVSGAVIEKTLGTLATFRNSNTVRRIASKNL